MAGIHPDFSRCYRLLGTDEPAIRMVFGPRALEFFARQMDHPLAAQSAGGWLVIFRHNMLVRPEELREFLREATFAVRLLVQGR